MFFFVFLMQRYEKKLKNHLFFQRNFSVADNRHFFVQKGCFWGKKLAFNYIFRTCVLKTATEKLFFLRNFAPAKDRPF